MTSRIQQTLLMALVGLGICASTAWGAKPESIEWIREYSEARRAGIDQDRPVVLFVTTEGCTHCDRMIDNTFTDVDVVGALSGDFVPAQIKLTPEDELAKQLKVTIYPTTIIIGTEGKILDYARGYLSASELQNRLRSASAVRMASID